MPEIPDYERPDLENYEESEFDPNKPGQKQLLTPGRVAQQGVEKEAETDDSAKNGLPKVFIYVWWCVYSMSVTLIVWFCN